MLLFAVIVYLLLTILIGFVVSRRVKTSQDFMLAGRSLPLALSTAALFATWFGSETVFGASSRFLEGGLIAVIEDPFGAALCLILFGAFFARPLYRMNILTLADYFRIRYGKRTEFIASIVLVPSYFGYTAAQLVALGLILKVVIGLAVWQGIVLSAVIVTLYTFAGGMWAISVTDFFQGILIVIGLIILSVVLLDKSGGIANVVTSVPASNFRFFPEPTWKGITTYMAAWSVLGLGSIPSQDVFQRAMSSGSEKIAVRSCYYAAFFYLSIAMLPLLISLCVKHLYPDQLGGDQQLVLPRMVLMHTEIPVQILFFGSLISAIMSTTSSTLLAPAAIVSENIVKPLLGNKLSDKQLLGTTRLALVLFAVGATVMATLESDIYELVGSSSIFSLVSLFVPLTLGLYWSRATAAGAILSIVFGISVWIIFLWLPIDIPALIPALAAGLIGMVGGSLIKRRQW